MHKEEVNNIISFIKHERSIIKENISGLHSMKYTKLNITYKDILDILNEEVAILNKIITMINNL